MSHWSVNAFLKIDRLYAEGFYNHEQYLEVRKKIKDEMRCDVGYEEVHNYSENMETRIDRAKEFIKESNRIEGINREPNGAEIEEFHCFMKLSKVTVNDLIKFVSIYEPDAVLRTKDNMNVRVGDYIPPPGGMSIQYKLEDLLSKIDEISAYKFHLAYESLHPFTDCNGRSGRMLWVYAMGPVVLPPFGFLHTFYYQCLENRR